MLTYLCMQSLTAPLQGFLNAIVYGWTREEFFKAITHRKGINSEPSRVVNEDEDSLFHGRGTGSDVVDSVQISSSEQEKRKRVSTDSGVFQNYQHYSS